MKKFVLLLTLFSFLPLATWACSYQRITHTITSDFWFYWPYYLGWLILIICFIVLSRYKIALIIIPLILIGSLLVFNHYYPIKTDEIHCATGDGIY